jgi:hypothetical protein
MLLFVTTRMVGWVGHVVYMGDMTTAGHAWVAGPEGSRPM